MALNTFEMNTIREVKALLQARQPVPQWKKQMMLDLIRREGLALTPKALDEARKDGLNVEGVKAL